MIFLTSRTAKTVLEAISSGQETIKTSLDLGLTEREVTISEEKWTEEQLEKIAEDDESVYFIDDEGDAYMAAIRGEQFYKLFPVTPDTAPALLIDGILMHRVKDITPLEDAQMKALLCARRGRDMLDTCTGLGYSTIACLDRKVSSIITIEKEKDVIELAKINPWSQRLFIDERVKMVQGSTAEKIVSFNDQSFDGILHDPPRFTRADELYSKEFYEELYRVIRSRGILYHYAGDPGSRYKRKDLQKGIMKRLREVGFVKVRRNKESFGVVALRL